MEYSESFERNEQKQIQTLDQQDELVAHHLSRVLSLCVLARV